MKCSKFHHGTCCRSRKLLRCLGTGKSLSFVRPRLMTHHFHSLCIVFIVTVACLFLVGCNESDQQTTTLPPLLQKTKAGGGWDSACPPRNEKERKMIEMVGRLAVSPEVEQRLRDEFPPGSSDDRLVAVLTAQGFKLIEPCETDQTIQRASFFQKGTGIIPYDVNATVYWKIDNQRRVIWTKGFLSYSGL